MPSLRSMPTVFPWPSLQFLYFVPAAHNCFLFINTPVYRACVLTLRSGQWWESEPSQKTDRENGATRLPVSKESAALSVFLSVTHRGSVVVILTWIHLLQKWMKGPGARSCPHRRGTDRPSVPGARWLYRGRTPCPGAEEEGRGFPGLACSSQRDR